MRGRKPRGPEIVDELPGGEQERARLKAILETLTGQLGITEAGVRLGLTPQRVHMLREQVLQAALAALCPGRWVGLPKRRGPSRSGSMPCSARTSVCSTSWRPANSARRWPWCYPAGPGGAKKKEEPISPETAAVLDEGLPAPAPAAPTVPAPLPAPDVPVNLPPGLENNSKVAEPPAAVPSGGVAAAAPGPDEPSHRQRLRDQLSARAQRRRSHRRGQAWQGEQRQRERRIRADAAALANFWQDQGVPAGEVATLLDCPARTLRHWQHALGQGRLGALPLGRPHLQCTTGQSQQVLGFLHEHGPWVGMPTLTAEFGDLAAAELRELLLVFRHLWVAQHPRQRCVLHWHQVGTVWGMDFTKVKQPIDGIYPNVFAVRDLASGMQLAWRPVHDLEAATAQAELALLFTIHGAPLVLKSDNGFCLPCGAHQELFGPVAGTSPLFTTGRAGVQWGHRVEHWLFEKANPAGGLLGRSCGLLDDGRLGPSPGVGQPCSASSGRARPESRAVVAIAAAADLGRARGL